MKFVIALCATGCYGTASSPSCSEDRTDVADSDPTALGTADDALAAAAGPHEAAATREDGTPVQATVDVLRGDGSAQWVDREAISVESRVWFTRSGFVMLEVICDDSLEVPATGALATDDGAFDTALDGVLTTAPTAVGGDGPAFVASVPFSGSGFPAPDEPEIATYDDQQAFLQINFTADGTTGRAGWEGDRVLADGTGESRAHYQLTW